MAARTCSPTDARTQADFFQLGRSALAADLCSGIRLPRQVVDLIGFPDERLKGALSMLIGPVFK
jgi:hypothetical protein